MAAIFVVDTMLIYMFVNERGFPVNKAFHVYFHFHIDQFIVVFAVPIISKMYITNSQYFKHIII